MERWNIITYDFLWHKYAFYSKPGIIALNILLGPSYKNDISLKCILKHFFNIRKGYFLVNTLQQFMFWIKFCVIWSRDVASSMNGTK